MLLYHGSANVIEKPKYGFGKNSNDYGIGFYCTENFDLACEWAVDIDRDGFANCYDFAEDGFKLLDLSGDEFGILNWMAILLTYRDLDLQFPLQVEARKYIIENFYIDVDDYDIVKGYRADDSYFSFARAFLSNTISYRQLVKALYLGNLGQQIVLKSEAAFNSIIYKGEISAKASEWYAKKQYRDLTARRAYKDMLSEPRVKGDIYINNIMDEEMKEHDIRLR